MRIFLIIYISLLTSALIFPQREGYNDPSADRYKTANNRDSLINKVSDFYYRMEPSGSNYWSGTHWNVNRFPLQVYVQSSRSKYYKPLFKEYISYALRVWQKAEYRIKYNFTNNINDADITFSFVDNLAKKYNKNYLGLTEYTTNGDNEIRSSKIQISLLRFDDAVLDDGDIKATIIHELGHALGLAHSQSEEDIMFPYLIPKHSAQKTYDELSRADKQAIKDVMNKGTGKR